MIALFAGLIMIAFIMYMLEVFGGGRTPIQKYFDSMGLNIHGRVIIDGKMLNVFEIKENGLLITMVDDEIVFVDDTMEILPVEDD